jgi:hypothetical protein
VADGQGEECGARCLHRVPGEQVRDGRLVEGTGLEHRSFGVVGDQVAEQVVIKRRVDHHHGEQVERERERVGAEAEAVRADAAVFQRVRHLPR